MPGQKMKYWEERRVKLRVELGPQDLAAGTCVLATAAAKPGDLATKVQHKVRMCSCGAGTLVLGQKPDKPRSLQRGPDLLQAVRTGLGLADSPQPPADDAQMPGLADAATAVKQKAPAVKQPKDPAASVPPSKRGADKPGKVGPCNVPPPVPAVVVL